MITPENEPNRDPDRDPDEEEFDLPVADEDGKEYSYEEHSEGHYEEIESDKY